MLNLSMRYRIIKALHEYVKVSKKLELKAKAIPLDHFITKKSIIDLQRDFDADIGILFLALIGTVSVSEVEDLVCYVEKTNLEKEMVDKTKHDEEI